MCDTSHKLKTATRVAVFSIFFVFIFCNFMLISRNMQKLFAYVKKFVYLCTQNLRANPNSMHVEAGNVKKQLHKRRLLTLVLTVRNFATFKNLRSKHATIDVCVGYITLLLLWENYILFWRRLCVACIWWRWAMRRPLTAGQVTITGPALFVYVC